jgi:hypothetical protein
MWNLGVDQMSENKNSKTIAKIEPTQPILKLVYDADKEKEAAPPVKERQPSRMVSFMNAFADSIDNDIRTILEY